MMIFCLLSIDCKIVHENIIDVLEKKRKVLCICEAKRDYNQLIEKKILKREAL